MSEPITFVCMTTPNLHRMEKLLPTVLPYVDRAVIVIGRRNQLAEDYLTSLGEKVTMVYRPWDDSFANQWNEYLKHVNSGWILICDDDEVPSEPMLKALRPLVEESNNGNNYSLVKFQANPISEGSDLGPSGYHREIFFKYNSSMKYFGGPQSGCHQYLTGYFNSRSIKRDEVYYHIKSLKDEYEGASRNYFIYGIWLSGAREGIQREEWKELKYILKQNHPGVELWGDFNTLLKNGNISQPLKEWMIRRYKQYQNHPEYNEMRALPVYYFRHLHPEEDVDGVFK